jgi:hypothetical protein
MGSFAWRPPFPEALRGKEPVGPRLLQLVNNAAQLLQDPLRVVAQHGCELLVVSHWLMGRAARALSVISYWLSGSRELKSKQPGSARSFVIGDAGSLRSFRQLIT